MFVVSGLHVYNRRYNLVSLFIVGHDFSHHQLLDRL